MALFDEKYGDEVRVLSMGRNNFSVELCGGTHVAYTGAIGCLIIVAESGIASGVRRIEAITGVAAERWMGNEREQLAQVARVVKGSGGDIVDKVVQLHGRVQALEHRLAQRRNQFGSGDQSFFIKPSGGGGWCFRSLRRL